MRLPFSAPAREWFVPPEFAWPTIVDTGEDPRSSFSALRALLREWKSPSTQTPHASLEKLLCDLATRAWRARQRLVDPKDGTPLEETRRVFQHVDGILDRLRNEGFTIQSHNGEKYVEGMALQVVAFQTNKNRPTAIIVETVRPSIYLNNQLLQVGEVIVERP